LCVTLYQLLAVNVSAVCVVMCYRKRSVHFVLIVSGVSVVKASSVSTVNCSCTRNVTNCSRCLVDLLLYICHLSLLPSLCLLSLTLLISAPSLKVLLLSTIDSVCPSVCHTPSNCFFFFVSRFFRRQFSMCPSIKRCSSSFDLGPLTPKIYSPKFAQNRL